MRHNKHISHNKHTFLALTKIFLFQEGFSLISQTKNPLELLETFFKSENFYEIINKNSNFNTRFYTT